jgi:hypothetical protein
MEMPYSKRCPSSSSLIISLPQRTKISSAPHAKRTSKISISCVSIRPQSSRIPFHGTSKVGLSLDLVDGRRLVQSFCNKHRQGRFSLLVLGRAFIVHTTASRCLHVSFLVNISLRCVNGTFDYLQLLGTKTWTFIPPEVAPKLYNPLTGTLPKTIDSTDSQFPFLQEARSSAITVIQYPGETIFVPSGWHHQVVNHG